MKNTLETTQNIIYKLNTSGFIRIFMLQDIKAPITVYTAFNHRKNKAFPFFLKWDGRGYRITSVNLHHTYRSGPTLFHAFSVSTKSMSFKLVLNTKNLFWTVEQITDGIPE